MAQQATLIKARTAAEPTHEAEGLTATNAGGSGGCVSPCGRHRCGGGGVATAVAATGGACAWHAMRRPSLRPAVS